MAYGTVQGVEDNLLEYDDIIDKTKVTAEMVARKIVQADGVIDMRLASIVGMSPLPLADPPQVIKTISEYYATCYILTSLFTQKDPNESDWTKEFCVMAKELLDGVVENPDILGPDAISADADIESSTEDLDEKAIIEQTSGGAAVEPGDKGESPMDDW